MQLKTKTALAVAVLISTAATAAIAMGPRKHDVEAPLDSAWPASSQIQISTPTPTGPSPLHDAWATTADQPNGSFKIEVDGRAATFDEMKDRATQGRGGQVFGIAFCDGEGPRIALETCEPAEFPSPPEALSPLPIDPSELPVDQDESNAARAAVIDSICDKGGEVSPDLEDTCRPDPPDQASCIAFDWELPYGRLSGRGSFSSWTYNHGWQLSPTFGDTIAGQYVKTMLSVHDQTGGVWAAVYDEHADGGHYQFHSAIGNPYPKKQMAFTPGASQEQYYYAPQSGTGRLQVYDAIRIQANALFTTTDQRSGYYFIEFGCDFS